MATIQRRKRESKRVQHYFKMKKLQDKNENLERKVRKFRKRIQRLQERAHMSDSPRSQLNRDLKKYKIPHEVKRKLIFRTSLSVDVEQSYREMKSKKKKCEFMSNIHFKYRKKYHCLSDSKPLFQYEVGMRRKRA